jgi:hypothetical protein
MVSKPDDKTDTHGGMGSPVEMAGSVLRVTHADFAAAFPYHFVVDQDCRLVQAGKEL